MADSRKEFNEFLEVLKETEDFALSEIKKARSFKSICDKIDFYWSRRLIRKAYFTKLRVAKEFLRKDSNNQINESNGTSSSSENHANQCGGADQLSLRRPPRPTL